MLLEGKILNPVCIRMGNNFNIIMADRNNKEVRSLEPGVMFGGEHYGFVLIIDYNGRQKEIVYSTQCKIEGVGIEYGCLKIFEEGKKTTWVFDKSGKLQQSAFDEFTDEFRSKIDTIVENNDMVMGKPSLKNPISIKIARNPEDSVILNEQNTRDILPLIPGAMFGGIHYGFILIIDTEKGQKEMVYPTQNRIDAIGIEGGFYGDLKIFEKGKYYPWLFTYDGKLKNGSSYNQYSKSDKELVEDCCKINENDSENYFTLQKKRQ